MLEDITSLPVCHTVVPDSQKKESVQQNFVAFENRQERISQPFKKGENSLQIHGPNWWTSHLRTGLPRWQSRLLNQSFLNTLLSTRHHSKDMLQGIGELD